jgi:plastocyanin
MDVRRCPYSCVVVVVLSLLLAACSSSSKSSTPTTAPAASSAAATGSGPSKLSSPGSAVASGGIDISGFAYSGALTVKPGQKVTVTNKDSVAHTLTDKKTHLFDTGNIPANGGTGTFTAPTKPGSYPFGCTYHPEMAGTLIVQG